MVDHENEIKHVHYTYNLIQIYVDIFAHSADPTAEVLIAEIHPDPN